MSVGVESTRRERARELPPPVGGPVRRVALPHPILLETLAVLLAPLVLYVVLRIRGMAPVQLPDPAMHTTFILDPHAILERFSALFEPTARLREAGRVGFLVPGRILYLLFGPLGGFFALRYLLALIATGPLYVLLRRLYGRWAGFAGIAVVMSSPVVLTAWGTDYPDSAAVSYLMGALCCYALAWAPDRRGAIGWLIGAATLTTFAVWSHGAAVPLIGALAAVWLAMRVTRQRDGLPRDIGVLVVTALAVTLGLALLSKLLIGQFNFISPTIKSAQVLSSKFELSKNHSTSWRWAGYVPYLLVPPVVIASFLLVGWRRRPQPVVWFVGFVGLAQLAVFAWLQFEGSFQSLEMHFFSSTLWSSVDVVLAVVVAELARPLVAAPRGRLAAVAPALPALLVLGVAWLYELVRKLGASLPLVTWSPRGLLVALVVVLAVAAAVLALGRRLTAWAAAAVSAAAILVLAGGQLFLTVAHQRHHGRLAGTVFDPRPAYDNALGGNDTIYVDEYAAAAQIPAFVGPPAYKGEALVTWEPKRQFGALQSPMGIYHNAFTWLSKSFPVLDKVGVKKLAAWRPGQVVLMSRTGQDFARAVRSLHAYGPVVVRRAVLSHGSYHLHIWLIDLRRYLHPAHT